MRPLTISLAVAGVAALLLGALLLRSQQAAAVTGPCTTSGGAMTTAEWSLLQQINTWRASQLGRPAMAASHSANLAAQWHADAIAAGAPFDHEDEFQRLWDDRLRDCEYDPYWAGGSGEALAMAASASAALASITDNTPGHQNGVQAPAFWKCAGVGNSGNIWVVVVAQYSASGPCPDAVNGPSDSPTNTPTASPTASPTTQPPTATPTEPVYKSFSPNLGRD